MYEGQVRTHGQRGACSRYLTLQTSQKRKDAQEHGKQIISNKENYPSYSDTSPSTLRVYTSHIEELEDYSYTC